MAKSKKSNEQARHNYEIEVNDWYAKILFNDAIYQSVLDDREFEERISIDMLGRINSTTSKRCKENMAAIITMSPNESWYNRERIREDLHTIGYINIEKADSDIYEEDTICFWVSVPTKSFDLMKDYISYRKMAKFIFVGTELSYRKGEIYSLEFGKECD